MYIFTLFLYNGIEVIFMLANRLTVLLAERGLSIKEVVEATGISRNTISNLSNNPTGNINTETTDILCNYLQVTPNEFFEYSPFLLSFYDYTKNINDVSYHISELYKNIYSSLEKCMAIKSKQGDQEYMYSFEGVFSNSDDGDDTYTRADKYNLYISLFTNDDFGTEVYSKLSIRFKKQTINALSKIVENLIRNVVLKSDKPPFDTLKSMDQFSVAIRYSFLNIEPIMASKVFDNSKMKFK